MKIFVTGSESFVGAELISQCRSHGIEVLGVDLADKTEPGYRKADVRWREIADLIPERVDAIVHLAALSRDPDCKDKAYQAFDINVLGALNLIDAAQARRAKQFVFASTEWVYDRFNGTEEKDEESAINALNLTSEYALSKLVSEINLKQKYNRGFCSTTVLRFGIIYGPRKKNWSAVESLFDAVGNKKVVEVGCLKTARRFIHVSDIAAGLIKCIGLQGFHTINLQGERLVSLGEIIEIAKKLLKKDPVVVEKSPDQASIRNVSNRKAKELLGWQPKIDIETGLRSLMT